MSEPLIISPVFRALTKPAMILGVLYDYFYLSGLISLIVFIYSGNLLAWLVFLPLHLIGVILCRIDQHIFSLLSVRANIGMVRNKNLWGINVMKVSSPDFLKPIRNEAGVSKHLNVAYLHNETLFIATNGQLGSCVRLAGIPFQTIDNETINHYQRLWHHALCCLNDEFCVYLHTQRRLVKLSLDGEFADTFSQQLNDNYQKLQKKPFYENEHTLTLIHKPLATTSKNTSLRLLQKINHKAQQLAYHEHQQTATDKFIKARDQLVALLTDFQPHLLGSNDKALGFSELLVFLSSLVNGNELFANPYPISLSAIGKAIDDCQKQSTLYPHGNLSQYLARKRLFFGEYIELQEIGQPSLYASLLTVKSYGTLTTPCLFDKLLQLDCEYLHTNSFALTDSNTAHSLINKQVIKLENASNPSLSQLQQLVECRDELASDQLKVGYHHNSLMLISDNLDKLKQAVQEAIKLIAETGFVAMPETLGQEAAFWAQFPCNQKYIVRSTLITSKNFVDFCSLHNYQAGYRDGNHLGAAVSLLESSARTPIFFNFHSRGTGRRTDITPGHTTIIGGNGSGKTVFMGFMDSQMGRYGGRSFFFDRDRGLEIYVNATNGHYLTISPNHNIQLNPFSLGDSPSNRQFLKKWLTLLVSNEGEHELPADIQSVIAHCIDYAYENLIPSSRQLSSAIKLLPIDFPRWHQLNKWLKQPNQQHHSGDYAYLFDHQQDNLSLNLTKTGFDLTELFNLSNTALTATMMYLFHRIEETLDGQRVSIYLDEGWAYLDNPFWQNKLRQWLPTLRKKNCHIVLATQSPASVVESSLSAQLLDNCATNIFFCNPQANFEKQYRHFSLSNKEFDFIKKSPPSQRYFLYK